MKVEIYTDGACHNNPGPAGIGAVLKCGNVTKVMADSIGEATNNIAELTAIRNSLLAIKDKTVDITLYSDSTYAINMITKGWKAKKNQELILEIIELTKEFSNLEFKWVRAHNGDTWNELADKLANSGVGLAEKHEQKFIGSFNLNDIIISRSLER